LFVDWFDVKGFGFRGLEKGMAKGENAGKGSGRVLELQTDAYLSYPYNIFGLSPD
jgi:hypothetical protein